MPESSFCPENAPRDNKAVIEAVRSGKLSSAHDFPLEELQQDLRRCAGTSVQR